MNASVYTQQAERLRSYLSDAHKVRLKSSSALEAVAALHGVRDWNTLKASERSTTSPPPIAKTLQGPIAGSPSTSSSLFGPHTLTDPAVSDALLSRQSFVQGGEEPHMRSLLEHLARRQIERGGRVLFLDMLHGYWKPMLQGLAEESSRLTLLKSFDPLDGISLGFDPLKGLSPSAVVSIVMASLPYAENSPGADYYRQQSRYMLSVVVGALAAAGRPLTFRVLEEALGSPASVLVPLQKEIVHHETAALHLRVLLDGYGREDGSGKVLDEHRWRNDSGSLRGRLFGMTAGLAGNAFHPENRPHWTWSDFLEPGSLVHWTMPSSPTSLGNIGILQTALAMALQEDAHRQQPLTVFLVGASPRHASSEVLVRAVQRGGHGLLVTGEASPEFEELDVQGHLEPSLDVRRPSRLALACDGGQVRTLIELPAATILTT